MKAYDGETKVGKGGSVRIAQTEEDSCRMRQGRVGMVQDGTFQSLGCRQLSSHIWSWLKQASGLQTQNPEANQSSL